MAKNGSNGKNGTGATPGNSWAGAGRRGDGKIRVAIVGVGNCASSLVQGRYYYENAKKDDFVPGRARGTGQGLRLGRGLRSAVVSTAVYINRR